MFFSSLINSKNEFPYPRFSHLHHFIWTRSTLPFFLIFLSGVSFFFFLSPYPFPNNNLKILRHIPLICVIFQDFEDSKPSYSECTSKVSKSFIIAAETQILFSGIGVAHFPDSACHFLELGSWPFPLQENNTITLYNRTKNIFMVWFYS